MGSYDWARGVSPQRVTARERPSSRVVRLVQAAKAVLTRRAVETPMKTLDGL